MTFLWGLVGTPMAIALAEKFRLLDVPGGRKKHRSVMPRGAGLVLWSGYLLWALFTGNPGVEVPYIAMIFIVGYMDDMHPLPPLVRLIFHLMAAAWVVWPLPVPLWQRALLILWIAGATNAYNLIDGMDGLCLTITLITSLCALIVGSGGVSSATAAARCSAIYVRRSSRGAFSRISLKPDSFISPLCYYF